MRVVHLKTYLICHLYILDIIVMFSRFFGHTRESDEDSNKVEEEVAPPRRTPPPPTYSPPPAYQLPYSLNPQMNINSNTHTQAASSQQSNFTRADSLPPAFTEDMFKLNKNVDMEENLDTIMSEIQNQVENVSRIEQFLNSDSGAYHFEVEKRVRREFKTQQSLFDELSNEDKPPEEP